MLLNDSECISVWLGCSLLSLCSIRTESSFVAYSTGRCQKTKIKMGLHFFPFFPLSICLPAVLFINLLFICAENSPPVSIFLSLSGPCLSSSLSVRLPPPLPSVSAVTVTYNYSADLLPVSITSAVQRNCRSVEESIVGVPGGFLDNELAQ